MHFRPFVFVNYDISWLLLFAIRIKLCICGKWILREFCQILEKVPKVNEECVNKRETTDSNYSSCGSKKGLAR